MELDEIDTPRDWPGHVREFLTLEQLLRCEICFKFFTNCMMTSCSHNFCSLCIRKHLSYKSTCPICFKETIEPALKSNRLIDEVVIAFSNARSKLIEMLQGTVVDQNVKQPFHSRHTLKNEPIGDNIYDNSIAISTLEKTLPIGKPQTETKTTSLGLSKRSYLPKKVYNLMKDKEIKDCLRKAGLNLKGKREELVQRYKQYVILYNAECDSENPRQVSELVKEIEEQEKLRLTLNNRSHKNFSTNHRSNVDDIEKEREQYVQNHSSQFQTLIDEIKHRQFDALEDEPEVMILPMPSTSKDSEPKIYIELSSDSSDSESTSSDRTLCAPRSNCSSVTKKCTGLEDPDETFLFSSSDSTLPLHSLSRHTTDSDSDLPLTIGEISPVMKREISSGANACNHNHVTKQNDHVQNGDIQALSTDNQVVKDGRLCIQQDQPGFYRKRKVTNMDPTTATSDLNINPESSGRRLSLRKRNSPPLVSESTKRNRAKKM